MNTIKVDLDPAAVPSFPSSINVRPSHDVFYQHLNLASHNHPNHASIHHYKAPILSSKLPQYTKGLGSKISNPVPKLFLSSSISNIEG
jgi:hypothetical protein